MAVTNVQQFALGLRRFQDRAEGRRRDMTRAVALRALRGLVQGTRFDTGRAKGNWQAGESRPPEGEVDRLDKDGTATISVEGRKILAMKGNDVIWLHNGVPYIGILEDRDKMLVGNVEALRTWIRSQ